MKMKKVLIAALIGCFCLAGAPAVTSTDTVWAAKGGISVKSAPRSMPAVTKPAGNTGTTSNNAKQAPKTGTAGSQTKQQAAANTKTAGTTAGQTSRFGNTLRNIGLLAGGMFLGSMLAGLLGWGSMGILSTILGLFMNLLILMALIAAVRWLWHKIRRNGRSSDDAYRRGYEAAMRDKNNRHPYTIDVKPLDDDDEKKNEKKS